MRKAILAARDMRAHERIVKAAAELAEIKGLDAPKLGVQARDKAVRAMRQREAVADFLEALLAAEKRPKPRRKRTAKDGR